MNGRRTMVVQPLELRRNDYTLTEQESAVADLFTDFFRRECPAERVRAAEASGFDRFLWEQLAEIGALAMGVPEKHGGDGASFVELVLMMEQAGRHLAPAPLVEVISALRFAASALDGTDLKQKLAASASGECLTAPALLPWDHASRQLIPAGSVARSVVGVLGEQVVVLDAEHAPPQAPNLGAAPLGWWSLSDDHVKCEPLNTVSDARLLLRDLTLTHKLLTAASLNGVAVGAVELAVDYARERQAFGSPIGSYQAVSHPLVDAAIAIEGSRRLTRKAAWFWEHEHDSAARLVLQAHRYAVDTSNTAATTAVHVHGGFGLTLEADIQLFFRRAKGWSALTGRTPDDLTCLADLEAPESDHAPTGGAP